MALYKHCCPSLITIDDHTDYCLSRQAEIERLTEQLRIATEQLQAFSDQNQERYPGEMGTFAHDALIQMSVVE